jgi:hypothetical protein
MNINGRGFPEQIIGAAILGASMGVYWLPKPFRHGHVMAVMAVDGYGIEFQEVQGFWTDRFRFVTREEALDIAKENGQFRRKHPSNEFQLFSEDLW